MSKIRKQSILSSVMVYIGFAMGFLNTYLYTREGGFSKVEYGLVNIFIAIATLMYTIANLGMPNYLVKFFPYYKDHLPRKKNDLLTWSLLVTCLGFAIITFLGVRYQHLVILKFGKNSPQLVTYYYWIFPFGFGLTLFTMLEAYAWQLQRPVITNFLREIVFRLLTTILIVLALIGWIGAFDLFIKLYAFTYPALALMLLIYLWMKGEISFSFKISKVTRRYYKKILTLISFVFGGTLLYGISLIFDSLVIASVLPGGLNSLAIFTLGQYMANLIQAPQRGIISSSMGPLSQAWKDKDLPRIDNIYKQSSINQLIVACSLFALIWLNFQDGIHTFHLQKDYLDAQWIFFIVGIYRIIDMGTGVNAQIISTSTLWRFEFYTGTVLLLLTLPLTYFLTKSPLQLLGPPVATLISFIVYNSIRCWFLWHKYQLQPFTVKTLYTVLLTLGAYGLSYLAFHTQEGILWMIVRSLVFILLFGTGALYFNLSKDLKPVLGMIQLKLKGSGKDA